jgi:hypothetical protein
MPSQIDFTGLYQCDGQAWRKRHALNEPLSIEGVGEEARSAATAAPTLQAGFYLTVLHWAPTGSPTLP